MLCLPLYTVEKEGSKKILHSLDTLDTTSQVENILIGQFLLYTNQLVKLFKSS